MSDEIQNLKQRIEALDRENGKLKAEISHFGETARAHASHEQRYRTLFDSIDEGFCIIEFIDSPHGALSDYIHIDANAAYARHTGIPNVVGQKVRDMVPDEAQGWVDLYRNVLVTGESIRFERELVKTARHLELAAFRIEPASLRQVAVLFQDVTARKRAELDLQTLNEQLEARVIRAISEREAIENALRQAQKMEAVGQLTGGIAHDFNNMLAVIISSLRLAERRLDRGDTNIREYLDGALKSSDRAAKLVARLLAFSRQQPLNPQRTDANQLLGGLEDVLHRTIPENIRIELVRAAGLWATLIDRHGLESAIVNLAVNARDAMPDGGRLTIETANTHIDEAYAAAHAELKTGQYILIAVTDNGCGMPHEAIERAFDPFFTTKDVGAGTGLGLSQVYGFTKQSGGHAKIYSEVGVGTTVKMYFPRLLGEAVQGVAKSSTSEPRTPLGRGELVLVVEDDDDVRRLTVEILTELGYEVIAANGAVPALALIEERPSIALLMTDIVMPGLNGRKLADQALAKRPTLKVLFTTGYTRNAIIHNGVLDQGVDLIVKPYAFEALAGKIAKILGAK